MIDRSGHDYRDYTEKDFPCRSAIVNVWDFSTLVKDTRNKGFKHILLTLYEQKCVIHTKDYS